MRVLVTGAYGFIGSHLVAALDAAGHEVICAVRRPDPRGRHGHLATVACDLARDTEVETWSARLRGVDAVINAAGILRESGSQTFAAIHRDAPKALFEACRRMNIRKVVQISALGAPEDSRFVRSKHEADEYLAQLDLDWTIVRPSVVYTATGSYGGTSLLRAISALPGLLPVPGDGNQLLQPIRSEDLALAVARIVESDVAPRQILEAVGPRAITISEYLRSMRSWLGFPNARLIPMPLWLIRPLVWLGERLGKGPLGETMFRMLQRGNVGSTGSAERMTAVLGHAPLALDAALRANPSHVQDRWHARLYFVRPALRVSLGLLWVASGLVGFFTPFTEARTYLAQAGFGLETEALFIYGASTLDIVIGVFLLARWAVVPLGIAMLALLIGYTVFLGISFPALWLEPFGSLIKNVPLIPAVLAMLAMEDQR